jgi:hypothetical protein
VCRGDSQISGHAVYQGEAEEAHRAPGEGREHQGLAAKAVGQGASDETRKDASHREDRQAHPDQGERDAEDVVEVDRAERKVQPVPEPEHEHGEEQQPHPPVEPADNLFRSPQHPAMIPGILPGKL